MSKSKPQTDGKSVSVPSAQFSAMVETMIELAMRNTESEAIVLRCAKAGGVKEVVKHITRMRVYAKKHSRPQRATNGAEDSTPPKGKNKRKKKRTPPPPPHRGNIGDHVPALDEL